MKRIILFCISAVCSLSAAAAHDAPGSSETAAPLYTGAPSAAALPPAPGRQKVLGSRIKRDTTAYTHRSLPSYVVIPKNDWQVGLSVSYMNLSADDGELFLLLDDSNTHASILRFSIFGSYSYKNNRTIGLRFQYTNGNCNIDSATLDLLGNFALDLSNVNVATQSYSGFIYHRAFVGLDSRGRSGLFLGTSVGYTRSRSDLFSGELADTYTANDKISAVMSPGFMFFPMNNISVFVSVSLAELSYNNSKCYNGGALIGHRDRFRAQAKINMLALNFGLTVHL